MVRPLRGDFAAAEPFTGKSIAMGHDMRNLRRWLSMSLAVFACLNGMLAIVYSHRTTADPSLALQNHDIWTEAAFFAVLYVVTALLVSSARSKLIVAAAVVSFFVGLIAVGDIVNSPVLTASAIGLVFLVGNLAGASVAFAATTVVLLRSIEAARRQKVQYAVALNRQVSLGVVSY
jgi:hypothetical protein